MLVILLNLLVLNNCKLMLCVICANALSCVHFHCALEHCFWAESEYFANFMLSYLLSIKLVECTERRSG